jgi:hypothetical protein
MSERKIVFLNGAAFWRPLIGLWLSLIAMGIIAFFGSPFHFPLISTVMFVVNIVMLMGCKSSFGRWLGRNNLPQAGLVLSVIGLSCVVQMFFPHTNHHVDFLRFVIQNGAYLIAPSLLVPGVLLMEWFCHKPFYVENSNGLMTWAGDHWITFADDRASSTDKLWEYLIKDQKLDVDDKLMKREWSSSYLVRKLTGQQRKAANQVCLEDHSTQKNRLFAKAIAATYVPMYIDKT